MAETKTCSMCDTLLPHTSFGKDSKARDGLRSNCSPCRRERQRELYRRNPEPYLIRRRAYVERNPHKVWEATYRMRCSELGIEPRVTPFTRDELIAYWANGERCIYCDGPFEQLDHHVAIALGGEHSITNAHPSCLDCNRVVMNSQKARAQKGE